VLLTVSAVDYQGGAVALERAAWSALGIVLGLAIAQLLWRLPNTTRRGPGNHDTKNVRRFADAA
jgi:hypothetical protein